MPQKKQSLKTLKGKLDKIFSLYIRARDKHCVICGSSEKLGNGHLFSRRATATRWDELNCHAQCWPCNYKHVSDFYPYQNWFVNKFGQEAYDDLYRKFKSMLKLRTFDLEILIEEYTEKLKEFS